MENGKLKIENGCAMTSTRQAFAIPSFPFSIFNFQLSS